NSCGSEPYCGPLGARLVGGGANAWPLFHTTRADPRYGYTGIGLMPQNGTTSSDQPGASAGVWMRAPIVRASTCAAAGATWWSPNATCIRTVWSGVRGSGC